MTKNIGGIVIDADVEDAMSIAHDIDALVNEQNEYDYYDGDDAYRYHNENKGKQHDI